MDPIRSKAGATSIEAPDAYESRIQTKIINALKARNWFVKNMHGGKFQSGVPDLYATHSTYGQRWIEVKHPIRGRFTNAQIVEFPKFCAFGAGIWVLTAATTDQLELLNRPYNYFMFLEVIKGRRLM